MVRVVPRVVVHRRRLHLERELVLHPDRVLERVGLVDRQQPRPDRREQLPACPVSCRSVDVCTAVGYDSGATVSTLKTLVEAWDGAAWSITPSPAPGRRQLVAGVVVPVAGATSASPWVASPAGQTIRR